MAFDMFNNVQDRSRLYFLNILLSQLYIGHSLISNFPINLFFLLLSESFEITWKTLALMS